MDLKDYFEVLLKRKWVVVLTACLATAATTVVTLLMTPIYEASTLLRIVPPSIGAVDYADMLYSDRVKNTYIRMLTSWPVLAEAEKRLDIPRASLEKKVKVEAIRDTELVRIAVEDQDRERAQRIAAVLADLALEQNQRPVGGRSAHDALAEQLESIQKELATARAEMAAQVSAAPQAATTADKVRALEETYGTLFREYQLLRVRESIQASSIWIIEPAKAAEMPVKPNRSQNIALGAVLGILAGIGLAFVAESLDKSIRSSEEIEDQTGVRVLGTLPSFGAERSAPKLVVHNTKFAHAIERYRLLRVGLQAATGDERCKALLFTSVAPGDGKSTVVANLAVAAAQAKQRVVIIDADFRRPSIHKVFGVSNIRGLAHALSREQSVSSLLRSTEFEGLKVITSGSLIVSPDIVFDRDVVKSVLAELRESFDIILVDGPPALVVADACLIAPLFDGVVVVAKYGRTSSAELRKVVSQISDVGANVIGTILNGCQMNGAGHYYNKYYERSSRNSAEH